MTISKMRKKIFEPLYCIKNNSPKLTYWKYLEDSQYYSLSKLQEIQWERLINLYKYLWKNNKFYQDFFSKSGLSPNSLIKPSDMLKIPILSKDIIRRNYDSIISTGYDKNNLLHFKTGGSTGKSLDIYITEECSELRNACTRRHDCWTGWSAGQPIAAVWGNPRLPHTLKEKLYHHLIQPIIYLDTMSISYDSILKFIDKWNNFQPVLLFGHAHSLFILAKHVQEIGSNSLNPTGIISTSMMLLPHERKLIEQVFKCKVTDRYGCEEVSLIASECENHEGMHLNIEHLFIEFIREDGTTAAPNEPGNIIVTDLMNMAMPFFRYKIDDVGINTNEICSCGRGLPILKKVIGRVADFLIKKNGEKVAGVSLIENTLTKIPGILQMQVVQKTIDDLHVNIVQDREYRKEVNSQLTSYFQKIFPGSEITINTVDEILPEKSGKYRFSICKIPNYSQ